MWRSLVAALLFVGFIPGVLVTLPSKTAKKSTIYVVHALLFALVLHIVMKSCSFAYESFGNHGASGCPEGFIESIKNGREECVPLSGTRENPPSKLVPK